ncbi:hypothetical protein H8958_022094 [Nasalis larvatus]
MVHFSILFIKLWNRYLCGRGTFACYGFGAKSPVILDLHMDWRFGNTVGLFYELYEHQTIDIIYFAFILLDTNTSGLMPVIFVLTVEDSFPVQGQLFCVKGQSIIPMLTGEVIPVMELLSSMKSHSVPEEIDIADTVLNDDDIGDSCHEGFLLNAISSHLQTCGCSVVVGSSAEKVNKIVRTLCLFLTAAERKCSRLCEAESSFKYESGLFVQGLLKDSTGSFVLPFRQVMYAPYPTTHIDVDVNTVKQMPPCHEHIYNQRRYMRSELTAFWRATSEEDMAQDTIIYTD